jgi:uncharacterized protein YabE (DUF348 family)
MLILVCITAVICGMRKTIIISVDGKEKEIVTYSGTLKKALSSSGIALDSKDKITPELNTNLVNGEKVYIKKAVNITVEHDGIKDTIKTAENNISAMLLSEKKMIIPLEDVDKINPSKDSSIQANMNIVIVRVSSTVQQEKQAIDFATEVKTDNGMEKGQQRILQEGVTGEKLITTKVYLEDNKEINRIVTEEVTREPQEKIVAQGTLGVLNIASRGDKVYYTDSIKVRATAYSAGTACTGKSPGDAYYGITASGTRARRVTNGYSSIAVDPSVIPIGTRLYVEGYGYAIAEDTGGAIKGNTIDVYYDSDSEANSWGVKWVNVYILK